MAYVEGVDRDGVAYVVWTDTTEDALADQGLVMPASYGESVHGTPSIVRQLLAADGQTSPLTPTGPEIVLAADDGASVLAWLRANTEAWVGGQAEEIAGGSEELAQVTDQVVY
jgi:hypothetical protein